MVWNTDNPADVEKIRLLGQVIRPNWKALQEASNGDTSAEKIKQWAINLIDRSNAAVTGANTPSRIDDVGQIYTRNDGSNNELFFLDSQSTAKETQLTKDGALNVATDKLASGTGYITVGSILIQWGSGSIGTSATATFTFPKAFSAIYQVIASYETTSTAPSKAAYVISKTTTNCKIRNSNGATAITGTYIAIGAA